MTKVNIDLNTEANSIIDSIYRLKRDKKRENIKLKYVYLGDYELFTIKNHTDYNNFTDRSKDKAVILGLEVIGVYRRNHIGVG